MYAQRLSTSKDASSSRNDGRMALAINGEYAHSCITASAIVEEATAWEMRNPAPVVTETLETVAVFVETEEPDP